MKLTKEQREVLRQIGKQARKETEERNDWPEILKKMSAQGKHGKKGGRPPWKYPPCIDKETGKKNKRHRFWNGRCSLCGRPQK